MSPRSKELLRLFSLVTLCVAIGCQPGSPGGGGDRTADTGGSEPAGPGSDGDDPADSGPGTDGSTGPTGVTLTGKTFMIPLGGSGLLPLSTGGDPAQTAVDVTLFTQTPTDSPSGCTLFVEPQNAWVTGAGTSLTGSITVAAYIGAPGSTNPCENGGNVENVGSFTFAYDGTALSLGVGELSLSGASFTHVRSGQFTLCLVASGDMDATLMITQMGVRFAESAEPGPSDPDGGDGEPGGDDGEVDEETINEAVAATDAMETHFDELLALAQTQGEEAAKQEMAEKIAADPAVERADVTSQGILIQYKSGLWGVLLLDPERGDPEATTSGLADAAARANNVVASGAKGTVDKTVFFASSYSTYKRHHDPLLNVADSNFRKLGIATFDRYLDEKCTLETYRRLDGYQIIHLAGHGMFVNTSGVKEVYLRTGQELTQQNKRKIIRDHASEFLITHDIMPMVDESGSKTRMWCGVSPDYVMKGLDLWDEGSLVWLGFCYSGLGTWQEKFIQTAGASACLAWDWSVWSIMDAEWARHMYRQMCDDTYWSPLTIGFWYDNAGATFQDPLSGRQVSLQFRGTPNLTLWEDVPGQPQIVGSVELPSPARDVYVSGSNAYVIDKDIGLQIVNVGNPQSPYIDGSLELSMHSYGRGISCDGTYAYVGCGTFQIIDVRNSSAPVKLSGHGFNADCSEVVTFGGRAYIAAGSYSYTSGGVFAVADITEPADADKGRGVAVLQVGNDIRHLAFTDDGRHVCLSDRDTGRLYVVDITDPANPSMVGEAAGGKGYGGWKGIRVSGSYAYVSNLNVFDVSNLGSPTLAHDGMWDSHDLEVVGNRAYFVGAASGGGGYLTVVDITDPVNPVYITRVDTPAIGVAIHVKGQYAYVAQGTSDDKGVLMIIDLGS